MARTNTQTPEDTTDDQGYVENEDSAAGTKTPAVTSTATTPTAVATTTPVNVLAPASAAPSPIAPATASPVAPAATPSPVAPAATPKGAPGAAVGATGLPTPTQAMADAAAAEQNCHAYEEQ